MSQVYDVILADPPWKYSAGGKGEFRAENHYNTMTIDDMCNLVIPAAENAVLFMWVVEWIHPEQWVKVARAWGFEYRTRAWVWVKSNPSGFGFWSGIGYYTRSNPEDCNLFIRGKKPAERMDVLGLIYSPRMKHSQKPNEQYEKIERLYPNARKLELFARSRREGWDVFGNQVEGSIRLPTKRAVDAATPSEVGAVLHNQISGERGGLA